MHSLSFSFTNRFILDRQGGGGFGAYPRNPGREAEILYILDETDTSLLLMRSYSHSNR